MGCLVLAWGERGLVDWHLADPGPHLGSPDRLRPGGVRGI